MRGMRDPVAILGVIALMLPWIEAWGWNPAEDDLEREYDHHARQSLPADAFPVFDDPVMSSAERASRMLRPNEWVIGVSLNGDHRAYPVEIMGVHELGNDTVGGVPISVAW